MRRPLLRLGLLLLLTLCVLGGPATAEDGPKTPAEIRAAVARWIEALGAETFEVRDAARKGLERYGAQALDLLEARRDDPDPEIKRQVSLLLERFGGVAPPAPVVEPGDLEALGRVTLELGRELTLAEALRRIGEPHGATFEIPDPDRRLGRDFACDDAPLFDALERLLAAHQLHAPRGFDRQGTLHLETGARAEPASANGPFRVRVVEVTRTKTIAAPVRHRFALGVELEWIPSIQLVTWRTPTRLAGTDDEGHAFEAGPASRGNRIHGIGSSATSTRLTLHLEPEQEPGQPDRIGRTLARLAFGLEARIRRDRKTLTFEDAGQGLPKTLPEGADPTTPGSVTLESLVREEAANGPWVVQLSARLESPVAERSLRVWLLSEDETARLASAGSRFTSSDGRTTLVTRAWGRWEKPPTRVRVVYFQTEEEGEVDFEIRDVPLR